MELNGKITAKAVTLTASAQTITYGSSISQTAYTLGTLATGDKATVTLTASTTNVTTNGTITPSIVIKDGNGVDRTNCYNITKTNGKLTIRRRS